MNFETLDLNPALLRNLRSAGYEKPTPIQREAITPLLQRRDMIGCAQTGTGKTAAFSLPLLHCLMSAESVNSDSGASKRPKRRPPRALILAPTRELAAQIGASLAVYGRETGLRHAVIFGGVGQNPQVRAVQAGIDILVATPGRLLDLIGQGYIRLGNIEVLILDEADQMLDMGFIHDLRRIVAMVPKERQTMLFSATMPAEIRKLASQWLRNPFELNVTPFATTPQRVTQSVYFVEQKKKPMALTHLLNGTQRAKTIVFSRTKRGADRIAKALERDGIRAVSVHGGKSQARRQSIIREFASLHPPVLVATDLAARGLDFSGISHVINYDLPDTAETYVHRIGRTARMGASGHAISFCSQDERRQIRDIEKLTQQRVPVVQLPELSESRRSKQNVERSVSSPEEKARAQPVTSPRAEIGRPAGPRGHRRGRRTSPRPTRASRRNSSAPHGRRKSRSRFSGGAERILGSHAAT